MGLVNENVTFSFGHIYLHRRGYTHTPLTETYLATRRRLSVFRLFHFLPRRGGDVWYRRWAPQSKAIAMREYLAAAFGGGM